METLHKRFKIKYQIFYALELLFFIFFVYSISISESTIRHGFKFLNIGFQYNVNRANGSMFSTFYIGSFFSLLNICSIHKLYFSKYSFIVKLLNYVHIVALALSLLSFLIPYKMIILLNLSVPIIILDSLNLKRFLFEYRLAILRN